MSDVLTLEEARAANLGAGLDDDALQDALDEEEAWLARRIGPLVGERAEEFALATLRPTTGELRLHRPTDIIDVSLDGVDITSSCELRAAGWHVAYVPNGLLGSHFSGTPGRLIVEYEPNDELEVRRALKELVGLTTGTQAAGGLQAEIMGSYSYTRAAGSATRIRRSIVRSLLEPPAAGSTRLLGSVRHGLAGALGR